MCKNHTLNPAFLCVLAFSYASMWHSAHVLAFLMHLCGILPTQPLHIGAMSGLGLSLYYLQDWDSALVVLEKLIAIHPGLDEIGQLRKDVLRQKAKVTRSCDDPI